MPSTHASYVVKSERRWERVAVVDACGAQAERKREDQEWAASHGRRRHYYTQQNIF